jgi:hypothetical protein
VIISFELAAIGVLFVPAKHASSGRLGKSEAGFALPAGDIRPQRGNKPYRVALAAGGLMALVGQ